MQYLRKLISLFYKNYSDRSMVISQAINIIPPMVKPIVKPIATTKLIKQKQGQSSSSVNK